MPDSFISDLLAHAPIAKFLGSLPSEWKDIPEIVDQDAEQGSASDPSESSESSVDISAKETETGGTIAQEVSSDLFSRALVRLLQCMICSYPLRDGVNLPCGHTICQQCLSIVENGAGLVASATIRDSGCLISCPVRTCRHLTVSGLVNVDRSLMALMDRILRLIKDVAESDGLPATSERLARYSPKTPWTYEVDIATMSRTYTTLKRKLRNTATEAALIPPFPRLCTLFSLAAQGLLPYEEDLIFESSRDTTKEMDNSSLEFPTLAQQHLERELDCSICYKLLLDPMTTSCGHTFCRRCLLRSLDFSILCPSCRQGLKMHGTLQGHHPNRVIAGLTQLLSPKRVDERKREDLAETQHGEAPDEIPLFVCTIAFPQVPIYLHIFEPRYRIMVRRSWEGNKQFGVAFFARELKEQHGEDAAIPDPARPGQRMQGKYYMEYGTIIQIVEKEDLPNGRINLRLVGVSRFRTLSVRPHDDGYLLARIERLHDVPADLEAAIEDAEVTAGGAVNVSDRTRDGSGRRDSRAARVHGADYPRALNALTNAQLLRRVQEWVPRYTSWLPPVARHKIRVAYGDPPLDDARALPYWTVHIMPVSHDELYRMLRADTVRERLKLTCRLIDEMEMQERYFPFLPVRMVTIRSTMAIVCLLLAVGIARAF